MSSDLIQHDGKATNSGLRTSQGDAPTREAVDHVDMEGQVNDATMSGFRLYAVAIGISFGAFMMSLDVSIIGTAVPSITSDFGDTYQIAWYPAAYTFATCILTPVAGKMAAVFPMKWVYIIFSTFFLVGSIVCAAAPSSNAFIAGRAIAGIGAAGVASNGLTILISIAPPKKKAHFMGMGAACFGIGLIIAPILGGVFSERVSWRWCFWINLPFIAITLTVVFLFFKKTSSVGTSIAERILRLDLIGCAIFVPSVFMLLLAMQRGGQENPWNSATIIGLFVGFGLTILVFVAWEYRRGEAALIPGSIVSRRTILCTTLFASCHMGALVIASYYLPYWFQGVQGTSPIDSGLRILPTVISQLLATIIGSGLAQRMKYYNPWFFLAGIFMCVANVLFTRFSAFDTPSSQWIGYQVLLGIGGGFGMQMPSLSVQLELADSPEFVPIGIALNMLMQYLGATVTQIVAGTIFTDTLQQQLGSIAGLSETQSALLIKGGFKNVHITTEEYFPELLPAVIGAYNVAITSAFYVAVAASALAFFLAFGIKWNKIDDTQKNKNLEKTGVIRNSPKPQQ